MYPIDNLANLVAMASVHEQLSLTDDIADNGQHEPAVLWRGSIVDGRCRQLACITLGIELLVRELDSNLSRDEVATVVKSLNTRRNLTDMQKAMTAYKQQEEYGIENVGIAKKWGIPLGTYKNARYIATNRPELVEPLFNGKSVEILDPDKGYTVTTNKINTLARIIKKTKELGITVVDTSERISFSASGLIKAEAGKDWYYSTIKRYNVVDPGLQMILVEHANIVYKLQETAGE